MAHAVRTNISLPYDAISASHAFGLALLIKNSLSSITTAPRLPPASWTVSHTFLQRFVRCLPPCHPVTLKSRRGAAAANPAAQVASVGRSATAQPLTAAIFAHALAYFSSFVETLPVKERGVFVDAIDRDGQRNDEGGVELDSSADLEAGWMYWLPALDHAPAIPPPSAWSLCTAHGILRVKVQRSGHPTTSPKLRPNCSTAAFALTPLRTISTSARHGTTVWSWAKRDNYCRA
ncbi:hypothetical protein BU17DRAFT_69089 [Hysterangium stoloniferum]|nr:hypothetical protein BU17DRAFT_69089 [Hysterangium stoloniferum]